MVKIIYEVNNFFMNVFYWILHFNHYKEAKEYKEKIRVDSIKDVKYYMAIFKWTEDKPWDWMPWVITMCARKLEDDCDGAAILGRYLLFKIDINSDLVVCSKGGVVKHMVCVSSDRTIMITNNDVIDISSPSHWKEVIINKFNGRYDEVNIW